MCDIHPFASIPFVRIFDEQQRVRWYDSWWRRHRIQCVRIGYSIPTSQMPTGKWHQTESEKQKATTTKMGKKKKKKINTSLALSECNEWGEWMEYQIREGKNMRKNTYENNGSGFPWILHGRWISLPRSTYMSMTGFWFVVGAIFVDISAKQIRDANEKLWWWACKWHVQLQTKSLKFVTNSSRFACSSLCLSSSRTTEQT